VGAHAPTRGGLPPWVGSSGMIGELSSSNKLNRVASVERLGLPLTISEVSAVDASDQAWREFVEL
jgi:hypothetical protein